MTSPPPARAVRFAGVLSGFHADVHPAAEGTGLIHGGESWASTAHFVHEHSHDGWEVYLQASGLTRWWVAGDIVEVRPADVLAVPPRVQHRMAERPAARHHFFYAAFDLDVVTARQRPLAGLWSANRYLHRPAASPLEAPFRRLVRELGTELPLTEVGIATCLDALVLEATRVFHAPGGRPHLGTVHPAVARARELLDQRYAERWTVPALAAAVDMSTAHLAEVFSREVGVPPYRYLVERRIERATELLVATDLPLTEIALSLGFASSSHFSRTFRELLRTTPRNYRSNRGAMPPGRPRTP